VVMRVTARGIVSALAMETACSLPISSSWMGMQDAIREIAQDCILKGSRLLRM